MKKIYEYAIVNKKDNTVFDVLPTRAFAREEKAWYKVDGFDVKIVQRVYKLEDVKEIR